MFTWQRCAALGTDLLFLAAITNALANFVIGGAAAHSYWVLLMFVFSFWLIRSGMQVLFGGSLGQLMTKVRIHKPLSWTQALLRNSWILLYTIPTIGPWLTVAVIAVLFVSVLIDPDRRGLHDRVAGTEVFLANK